MNNVLCQHLVKRSQFFNFMPCYTLRSLEQLKLATSNYWTSGIIAFDDRGIWCNYNGSTMDSEIMSTELNWLQKSRGNTTTDNCVTLQLGSGSENKSGLRFANCDAKYLFVCEASFLVDKILTELLFPYLLVS
jgi:hypothetical protein